MVHTVPVAVLTFKQSKVVDFMSFES